MEVFHNAAGLRRSLGELQHGTAVGFVPTMGFLHEGHLSLMRAAAAENDVVVVSIFVNPLQFGPSEDYATYPRDLERDQTSAARAGVTHLLAPSAEDMFPAWELSSRVEVGRIGEVCEGLFRPGHFSGVATICVKLFNIVQPDRAYFGEKDAQQLAVVRQVVRDFDIPVEIVACPTRRDSNGLALSSRNSRLSPGGLAVAAAIPRALFYAARLASEGELSAGVLKKAVTGELEAEPEVTLQYAEVVDEATFEPLEKAGKGALMALAAVVEGVRLIDNVRLDGPDLRQPC